MSQTRFKAMLRHAESAGPHQCEHGDVEAIAVAAAELGFGFARVDMHQPQSCEHLFDAVSSGLEFPGWFRRNWSGLVDCLTDMSWRRAPGYVFVVQGFESWANAQPLEFDIGLSVFGEAADYWREDDIPMWAVFAVPPGTPQFLPKLT